MSFTKKVKGNIERLFDKNLTDLVRGIRNNRDNEAKYIAQCIEEIKEELRQDNISFKANAVTKLTYLQMLGYDISWAAFNIIEVMSSPKFTHKRLGYLCASQAFHENTDVMMLTTNMIRKDLTSPNMYDSGCAMSGLACFVSPDLSRHLANDIMTLLTSVKPYLRKKAVLLMYKVFLKYPDALKPAFPRLKDRLEDPDPGVQSAAVNVICELARKNPKNYLPLAPVFFKLMTNSTNNWMLIKIIKLFSSLTPLEPRLGKKLIEPLTNLIHSTSAMSLLYECINTVIAVLISISSGLPNHNASIQLCVQKLRILIEDSDQNLKYLGLLAMSKILKTHPSSVQAHKDLVLSCLEDRDESIRLRALDLLYGMVSKKNLIEIVRKLLINITENPLGNKYRDELIAKIIDICSQNDYELVTNFEWYISVLVDLSRVQGGTEHGALIANQMLDVAIRVETIRPFAAEQMANLVENCSSFPSNSSVCEVLVTAAWVCGEYSEHLPDKRQVLLALLPTQVHFPAHVEAAFIHNASKIFVELEWNEDDIDAIRERLTFFSSCDDLEVQERTNNFVYLLDQNLLYSSSLFKSYPLNPVAVKAQKKVPLPTGLELDTPFFAIPVEETSAILEGDNWIQEETKEKKGKKKKVKKGKDGEKKSKKNKSSKKVEENIAVAVEVTNNAIENHVDATPPIILSSDRFVSKVNETKKRDKKKKSKVVEEIKTPQHQVTIKGLEMPEGVNDDDIGSDNEHSTDPHKALAQVVLDPLTFSAPVKKEKKVKKLTKKTSQKVEANGTTEQTDLKVKPKKKSKKISEETSLLHQDYEEAFGENGQSDPLVENEEIILKLARLTLDESSKAVHCLINIENKSPNPLSILTLTIEGTQSSEEESLPPPIPSGEVEKFHLKVTDPKSIVTQVTTNIQYSIKTEGEGATCKFVNVQIPIPLSTFIRPPLEERSLSQVVAELTAFSSTSIKFDKGLGPFLDKLLTHVRLKVIDQIGDEAATLQGTVGDDEDICFLIKNREGLIVIDAKSKNQHYLNRIIQELQAFF